MKLPSSLLIVCTLCLGIAFVQPLSAQGWRKTYDIGDNDGTTYGLLKTQDGHLILASERLIKTDLAGNLIWLSDSIISNQGAYNDNTAFLSDGSIVVAYNDYESHTGFIKFNQDGQQVLFNKFQILDAPSGSNSTHTLKLTPEGDILLFVRYPDSTCSMCFRAQAIKFDDEGNLIWSSHVSPDSASANLGTSLVLPTDEYLFGGGSEFPSGYASFLTKMDNDGNVLWTQHYGLGQFNWGTGISALMHTTDNQLLMAASSYIPDNTNGLEKIFLQKTDLDGNPIWTKSFFAPGAMARVHDLVENQHGQYVMVGTIRIAPQGSGSFVERGFMMVFDQNGDEVWKIVDNYGGEQHQYFTSIQLLDDGKYAILGNRNSPISNEVLLVVTDSLGNVYTHQLKGRVYSDSNLDCDLGNDEIGLNNRVVWATGDTDFYAFTDAEGYYSMPIDTGSYEISVASLDYWEPCQPAYPMQINTFFDSTFLDLPQQPTIDCPVLQVDIGTPFLRLCSNGYYAISYCNNGTVQADNATVQVTFPTELTYLGADAPLVSQTGQVFTFDLGNVGINECNNFLIYFENSCDPDLLGQTLCTEAHIFPDSICNNTWTGANLEVSGTCESDSVHFTITNTGGDMPAPFGYIVIEDNIILLTDEFELLEDQSFEQSIEAQSGATYHLIAIQDPNLPPIFGNPIATASVEGCAGPINTGGFNQIPQDDGEPWLDVDCQEVIASFDPNDKSSSPTGWTEEHFIDERTELDYLIRFQNTGTDTAFQVVLIDTLAASLDPATIRPGTSSHPYTFELSGQGIAKFTFADIMLPDSNVNEPASNGFVQFHIAQKLGNQPGTVIENTAGIYFDFNAPIYTNTTFHTIREPWVDILDGSTEVFVQGLSVSIAPNPMADWATIEVANLRPGENTLLLFDAMGREVLSQSFSDGKTVLLRENLEAGLFFFRVENDGKVVATGKLVVR